MNRGSRTVRALRIGSAALLLALACTALVVWIQPSGNESAAATGALPQLSASQTTADRAIRDQISISMVLASQRPLPSRAVTVMTWWKVQGTSAWRLLQSTSREVQPGRATQFSAPEWSLRAGTVALCVADADITARRACKPAIASGPLAGDDPSDSVTWLRVPVAAAPSSALDGDAMWIHQLDRSAGGRPGAIARRARAYGVETVIVKASGGTTAWPQFSSSLVAKLHAKDINVCAYQRVFGERPRREARLGIAAVRKGADCLVIDGESEYYGQHRQARTYVRTLRAALGADYPIGFTSFPYVSYHTQVPWRVFLGPGGAQYNLPQIYWKTIGDSVEYAVSRTWRENEGFGRPIRPIGQTYLKPAPREIKRFRTLTTARGAQGVSWWVWQLTDQKRWKAIDS